MAPIGMHEAAMEWPMVGTVVVLSLATLTSMVFTLVVCGCCGGKKKQQPDFNEQMMAAGGVGMSFYGTDPNSPDFCPDCAAAAASGEQPAAPLPGSVAASVGGGAGGGGGRSSPVAEMPKAAGPGTLAMTHKYAHKTTVRGAFKSGASPDYQTLAMAQSNVFEKTKKVGGGAAGAPGTGPSDAEMSKAAVNPMYQTLAMAQSGVFDQAKGKGAGQMGATQAMGTKSASNPAYQTLFGAQSDIFSKKAPKKGGMTVPEQSGGYRG